MSGEDGTSAEGGSGSIEVFLRVRPSPRPSNYFAIDDVDTNALIFNVPKVEENIYVNNSRTRYAFKFDGILQEKCSQEDVFRTVGASAVRNALDGFNSTVFAYGQTGSGKTFTITGGPERYADRGIIPRALSMLFSEFQRREETTFSCYVSYLELYNESGYDLIARDSSELSSSSSSSSSSGIGSEEAMKKVTMMEDEDGNYHFKNLTVHPVSTEEEALNLLFLGDTNRAIGETEMNQSSSRSHCIFTVLVEGRKVGSDTVVRSKLNLVDLAGSERVHKTSSSGTTLREAQYINTSLFFLEMVIVALHERTKRGKERTHVPYRNSMMTSVLRDSLGGNCKTLMVATISPEAGQTDESISTCQFAQRVALVKNNAQINEELEPEVIIRRLRGEVNRLREEVKFLKGENGEGDSLTEEQREELERLVRDYVDDRDERAELDIGSMTLTKIHDSYSIFKRLVLDARRDGNSVLAAEGASGDRGESNAESDGDIASLKKALHSRDQEIAILVDMVKKQGGKVSSSTGRIPKGSSKSGERNDVDRQSGPQTTAALSLVNGVERCRDRSILDEPSLAFDWFRERYPGLKAIEENKKVLKQKYKEAKETGELVQTSRSKINYHKGTIEKLRRDRAMEGVAASDVELQHGMSEPHPDELVHRKAIEDQKEVYKGGFHRLRELKAQIEHVQNLLEKSRSSMQSDFDAWYRVMCGQQQETSGSNVRNLNEGSCQAKHAADGGKSQSTIVPREHSADSPDAVGCNDSPEKQQQLELPPGVKLTGNKEVDEDIISFFRAKEELLARSKR